MIPLPTFSWCMITFLLFFRYSSFLFLFIRLYLHALCLSLHYPCLITLNDYPASSCLSHQPYCSLLLSCLIPGSHPHAKSSGHRLATPCIFILILLLYPFIFTLSFYSYLNCYFISVIVLYNYRASSFCIILIPNSLPHSSALSFFLILLLGQLFSSSCLFLRLHPSASWSALSLYKREYDAWR